MLKTTDWTENILLFQGVTFVTSNIKIYKVCRSKKWLNAYINHKKVHSLKGKLVSAFPLKYISTACIFHSIKKSKSPTNK